MTITRERWLSVPAGSPASTSNTSATQVSRTGAAALVGDSSIKFHSNNSLHVTAGASESGYAQFTQVAATQSSICLDLVFNTVPVSAQHLLELRNSSAVAAIFGITSGAKFQIQDAASATKRTFVNTVVAGQKYRIWLACTPGTTTANGSIQGAYFLDDNATVPSGESIYVGTASVNAGTSPITAYNIAKITNVTATLDANFGTVAMDNASMNDPGPDSALPPTANAGPDQTDLEPYATCTLTSTGSSGGGGTISSYLWRQISGPTVTLSSTTAASPTFMCRSASTAQALVFGLKVTNSLGVQSAEDTVSITYLPGTELVASGGVWVPIRTTTL